ncbi:hypothetical protein TSUD_161560 [Trifolium subterraneum]|uniref:Uncharacterized protein n=1 Tax=Trifolium subterraneum TaxID=3900 RepID=A0A2Z6MUV6_TRISU|nr:hypothetical protein TSUD_161560 [Trifolium subterraneum]
MYSSHPSSNREEQRIETEEQRTYMEEIIEMEDPSRPSSSRESKGKYPFHASSSREEQGIETEEQRIYTEEIIEMEDQIEMEEQMKRKKMEELKRKKIEEQIKMEEKMKRKTRAKKINNLALSVLGYSSLEEPSFESPHFLHLVHFFLNRTCERGVGNVCNDRTIVIAADSNPKKLKLKSCALRLGAAGEKKIIVDDTKMSNDELKEFFRSMPLGVDPGVVDPTYATMVETCSASNPIYKKVG